MQRHSFETLPDGRSVDCFVLASSNVELRVISYGAIITTLRTACRGGSPGDIVLGHSEVGEYCVNPHYLGAVIGRYANRIAYGRFRLNSETYQLATNQGEHHLHGGVKGFDQHRWAVVGAPTDQCVTFARTSPTGEERYPGTLEASVTYCLSADNVVEMRYSATTDSDTPVNLTQHTYFNLSGIPRSTILDHELTIHADKYTPVDARLIPEGNPASVDGTPFDFRTPRTIRAQLACMHEQLRRGRGFDHNWVLSGHCAGLRPAARLRDPRSGRILEVATTEPGLQFYGGQLLGRRDDSSAAAFGPNAGLCLETQHFPNSPNRPDFPSTILRPGERYESLTSWTFSLD
jgi:aldose 1-epimerase